MCPRTRLGLTSIPVPNKVVLECCFFSLPRFPFLEQGEWQGPLSLKEENELGFRRVWWAVNLSVHCRKWNNSTDCLVWDLRVASVGEDNPEPISFLRDPGASDLSWKSLWFSSILPALHFHYPDLKWPYKQQGTCLNILVRGCCEHMQVSLCPLWATRDIFSLALWRDQGLFPWEVTHWVPEPWSGAPGKQVPFKISDDPSQPWSGVGVSWEICKSVPAQVDTGMLRRMCPCLESFKHSWHL